MAYNRKLWFALRNRFTNITEESGIYVWTRQENSITFFYIGQAKNLRNRRTDYEMVRIGKQYPTRHFEASLRKHKDWEFEVLEVCSVELLDYKEREYIKLYNCMPNHVTRNDLLAEQDIVRSNYKRKTQIEKKVISGIKKCLGNLTITYRSNWLQIGLKMTKKGVPTALSKKNMEKLVEILGIGVENEEKI